MIKSTIILSGSKRYLKLFYESLLPEQNFKNDKGFYEMNHEKDLKINIIDEKAKNPRVEELKTEKSSPTFNETMKLHSYFGTPK